jgi:2-oxoglutarate ferredoxin oxidoreductase subunit beta
LRNPLLSYAMALMDPELPVPIGVLRKVQAVPFDTMIHDQLGVAREKKGEGDLRKLLYSGDIWDVK